MYDCLISIPIPISPYLIYWTDYYNYWVEYAYGFMNFQEFPSYNEPTHKMDKNVCGIHLNKPYDEYIKGQKSLNNEN